MNRKSLKRLFVGVFSCLVLGGLTACENPGAGHTHLFGGEYSYTDQYHYRTCICGEKGEKESHSFILTDSKAPTHLEEGYEEYTCSVCSYSFKTVFEKLNHDDVLTRRFDETNHWDECSCGDKVNVSAHTLIAEDEEAYKVQGEENKYYKHCSACDYVSNEKVTIDYEWSSWKQDDTYHWVECLTEGHTDLIKNKAEHTYGSWSTVTPATCSSLGQEKRVCSVCGHIETRDIACVEHEASTEWKHNETKHWHECAHCDTHVNENNHTFGEFVEVTKATETTPGSKKHTCTVCGYEETVVVPVLTHTHSWGTTWKNNSSYHWHECETCHAYKDRAAHEFTEWAEETPATCTTDGISKRHCTVCGYEESRVISKSGHDFAEEWKSNETHHWHDCCSCEEVSEKDVHTWGERYDVLDATEESEGHYTHKCTVCNYEETVTIPELAHVHNFGSEWKSNQTSHWHECRCGDKSEVADHTYGAWKTVTPSTCTAKGLEERACTVCGYKQTRELEKTAHEYSDDWKHNDTQHWHECHCGEKSGLANHDWAEIEDEKYLVTEASYTAAAVYYKSCSVCGAASEETFTAGTPIPANFKATVSETPNGTATVSKSENIAYNEEITIEAHPNKGYVVESIEVNGVAVELDGNTAKVKATSNLTIVVNFKEFGTGASATWEVDTTLANGTEVSNLKTNDENVTILVDKGTGKNGPKYYTSGEAVRLYSSNTMTVSTVDESPLNTVTFTFGSDDGSNEITCSVGTYDAATRTWTGDGSASSVTFTISGTSGNRRFVKVEVSYGLACSHDWIEGWQHDETHHWHECYICLEHKDEQEHTYGQKYDVVPATQTENGSYKEKCTVCGYVHEGVEQALGHEHNYSIAKYDENGHWHECACGEKGQVSPHELKNNVVEANKVSPATTEKGSVYYKSCDCGYCPRTETFELDDKLTPETKTPEEIYDIIAAFPSGTTKSQNRYKVTGTLEKIGGSLYFTFERDSQTLKVQVYFAKGEQDKVSAGQIVTVEGFAQLFGTNVYEISSAVVIGEPITPTYNITVADNIENGSVAINKTSAKAGETVEITVTPNKGYKCASVTVNDSPVPVTAGKATFAVGGNSVVKATFEEIQALTAGTKIEYVFDENTDFSSWSNSYAEHTLEFEYMDAYFKSANQNAQTITTMPVTKGSDVIFTFDDLFTVSEVKISFAQWGTKAQTINVYTSTDGETFTTEPVLTSENFIVELTNLEGVKAIKITFTSTNQIGIEKINFTVGTIVCEHTPSSEYSYNETHHWKECTTCYGHLEEAEHTYGEKYDIHPATETENGSFKEECTVCGYVHEGVEQALGHEHNFKETWKTSETHHWHECDCGEHSEEAEHTLTETVDEKYLKSPATTESKAVYYKSCSVCGYISTETFEDGKVLTPETKTVEEIYDIIAGFEEGTTKSTNRYEVSGTLVEENGKYYFTFERDSKTLKVQVYFNTSELSKVGDGYKVSVQGFAELYKGAPEISGAVVVGEPIAPTYTITVADGIENGTVTVSKNEAKASEEVTITVTPEEGYEIDTLTVNDQKLTVTDNTAKFTVQDDSVVNATFKVAGTPATLETWEFDFDPYSGASNKGVGTSSVYGTTASVEINGINWSLTGNQAISPFRIGGKDITDANRVQSILDPLPADVDTIEIEVGTANITVNSIKVMIFDEAVEGSIEGKTPIESFDLTFEASTTLTVNHDSTKDWTGKYVAIVFNVTNTTTSNKYVQLKNVTINWKEVHEHTISEVWSKDETKHWKECSGCTDHFEEAEHTYGEKYDVVEATETKDGSYKEECTVCGYVHEGVEQALGHEHNFKETWETSETHHWHECDCGEHSEEAEHTLTETVDEKYLKSPATTEAKAVYYKSCSVCGYVSTETFENGEVLTPEIKTVEEIYDIIAGFEEGTTKSTNRYEVSGTLVKESNKYYFTFERDSETFKVQVYFATGEKDKVDDGYAVSVQGFAYLYGDNVYEIYDAVVVGEPIAPTRTITIAEGIENGTVEVDKTSAAQNSTVEVTLKPNKGYVVDQLFANDEAVAVTDNKATITVKGDTVINATFKEYAGEATATWNVSSVTLNNATVVASLECNDKNVVITVAKGSAGTPPTYYTADGGSVRLYGGGTLTVSTVDGSSLKSIKFTFAPSDKSNEIKPSTGTYNSGTKTWTPAGNESTVTFTIGGTKDHRRFASITVTYAAECSHDIHENEWEHDETHHWNDCYLCLEKLNKAEHTYGEKYDVVAATETTAGSYKEKCTVCGYVHEGIEPAIGHKYGKPTYVWNGDECTATAYCETCAYVPEFTTITEPTNLFDGNGGKIGNAVYSLNDGVHHMESIGAGGDTIWLGIPMTHRETGKYLLTASIKAGSNFLPTDNVGFGLWCTAKESRINITGIANQLQANTWKDVRVVLDINGTDLSSVNTLQLWYVNAGGVLDIKDARLSRIHENALISYNNLIKDIGFEAVNLGQIGSITGWNNKYSGMPDSSQCLWMQEANNKFLRLNNSKEEDNKFANFNSQLHEFVGGAWGKGIATGTYLVEMDVRRNASMPLINIGFGLNGTKRIEVSLTREVGAVPVNEWGHVAATITIADKAYADNVERLEMWADTNNVIGAQLDVDNLSIKRICYKGEDLEECTPHSELEGFMLTETVKGTYHVDTAADCEHAETGHYEATFTNPLFEKQVGETSAVGTPLGHRYIDIDYSWDGDKCTATAVCDNNPEHTVIEKVTATYVKDTDADCEHAETGHYEATFTNTLFTKQVGETFSKGEASGHSYGEPTYVWNGGQCTATRVCTHEGCEHKETESANLANEQVTYEEVTPADCENAKTTRMVATFKNEAFETQYTEPTSVGTPLGHNYSKIEYSWVGDKCTATATCANDASHVVTETVKGTYVKDTDADCEHAETGHYEATFENELFAKQSGETFSSGNPLGHSYGDPTYSWKGDECTATRVCNREGCEHEETETVEGTYVKDTDADCEHAEKGHYEATFKNETFVKQVTAKDSVENGTSIGHKYDSNKVEYSWKDNVCTATIKCDNDESHTISEEKAGTYVKDTDAGVGTPETGHYEVTFNDSRFGSARTEANSVISDTHEGEHQYGDVSYSWNETTHECTATMKCNLGSCQETVTETVTADYVKDTDATCLDNEKGHYVATFTKPGLGSASTEKNSYEVQGTATGHNFDSKNVEYAWNKNSCTATIKCDHCDETISETKEATYVLDTQATTEAYETGHYEVTFTDTRFGNTATETGSVTMEQHTTDHVYGEATYTWDYVELDCLGKLECTLKGCTHEHTSHGSVQSIDSSDPDCEHDGSATYKAIFSDPLFTEQISIVKAGSAFGHDYLITYTWNENLTECKAVATCQRQGCEKTVEETVTVLEENRTVTNPDCENPGSIHASVTFNEDVFEAQEKEIEIAKLDHTYGTPTYSWKGEKCTATRVCTCEHKETETVTGTYVKDTDADCEHAETGHYEATFTNKAFVAQSTAKDSVTNTEVLALGHKYGEITCSWNDDKCTLSHTCTREGCEHVESETVTGEYVIDTPATCEDNSKGHYEATFTEGAFKNETRVTEANSVGPTEDDKLGHGDYVLVNAHNPTDTEPYYLESYYTCGHEGCDKKFVSDGNGGYTEISDEQLEAKKVYYECRVGDSTYEESLESVIDSLDDDNAIGDYEITLLQDVTITKNDSWGVNNALCIVMNNNVTSLNIDLNGHTLYGTIVLSNGKITITGEGTLTSKLADMETAIDPAIIMKNDAILILKDVEVNGSIGVYMLGGNLTVDGSTITGSNKETTYNENTTMGEDLVLDNSQDALTTECYSITNNGVVNTIGSYAFAQGTYEVPISKLVEGSEDKTYLGEFNKSSGLKDSYTYYNLNNVKWDINFNGTYVANEDDGLHMGSNSFAVNGVTFSTNAIEGKITTIVLKLKSNASTNSKVTVQVGNGSTVEKSSINSFLTDYTYTINESGKITITFDTNGSKKNIFIKSITVNYEVTKMVSETVYGPRYLTNQAFDTEFARFTLGANEPSDVTFTPGTAPEGFEFNWEFKDASENAVSFTNNTLKRTTDTAGKSYKATLTVTNVATGYSETGTKEFSFLSLTNYSKTVEEMKGYVEKEESIDSYSITGFYKVIGGLKFLVSDMNSDEKVVYLLQSGNFTYSEGDKITVTSTIEYNGTCKYVQLMNVSDANTVLVEKGPDYKLTFNGEMDNATIEYKDSKDTATWGKGISFKVNCEAGYSVSAISANDIDLVADDSGYYTVSNMKADVTVNITVASAQKYNVTVTVNDNNMGSAKADPAQAAEGANITVTPTPNPGFRVKSVKIGEDELIEDVGAYNFDMPAGDVEVVVTFEAIPTHNINVTINGQGSVTLDGSAASSVNAVLEDSGEHTLKFTPSEGFGVYSVTVNNEEKTLNDAGELKVNMAKSDINVAVTFGFGGNESIVSFSSVNGDIGDISYISYKAGGTADPRIDDSSILLYQNNNATNAGGMIVLKSKDPTTIISNVRIKSAMNTTIGYVESELTTAQEASVFTANENSADVSNGENYNIVCHSNVVTIACLGHSSSNRLKISELEVTYLTNRTSAPQKYAINITPSEHGTVTVQDNITEGYEGTEVTLNITPDTGYVLDMLTVNGAAVEVTGSSYKFYLIADTNSVSATFKEGQQEETKDPITCALNGKEATKSISSYTDTDTVIYNDISFTFNAFNNNNKSWSEWRCGRKSDPSTASIMTNTSLSNVKTVTFNSPSFNNTGVKTIKLFVYTNSAKTTAVETISTTIPNQTSGAATLTFEISTVSSEMYFKLEIDMDSHGKSNGNIQINSVTFAF